MNGLKCLRRFQQFHPFIRSNRLLVKNGSTSSLANNNKEKLCYDDVIRGRQAEAVRSIVVQVSSEKSFPELYAYCSDFGTIVNAQHYRIYHEDDTHYILLEFLNADEAAAAINSSSCSEDQQTVPVRSSFLWFKATRNNYKKELKPSEKQLPLGISLQVTEGTRAVKNNDLQQLLSSASCIEEQIKLLHQTTQLNDLGVRLRFLAALQVQNAVVGMFPEANAQPFGSSVNGFGKMGCDLDLILRFNREKVGEAVLKKRESRLVFHTKENLINVRSQVQRHMESMSDILQLFLPGVCHVRRILQARIPIIKYHHEHLNLEVDLSMSNLTGFYMSELLYMFGELDERVRPLTFTIRRWAQSCGLTNPSPGRWISNFSLTCLVIFFLQSTKQPILPPINALMKSAKQEDIRITEDGVNCTFARNLEHVRFQSSNTKQISELLLEFFEFYSQFDFHNCGMSLNEGRTITKPDHSALYIVNPLEQVLNVSKNVSLEECERLRIEVRNAAWVLESEFDCNYASNEAHKHESIWGLLNIFRTAEQPTIKPNMFFKSRMVDINELFDGKKAFERESHVASAKGKAQNGISNKTGTDKDTDTDTVAVATKHNTQTSKPTPIPLTPLFPVSIPPTTTPTSTTGKIENVNVHQEVQNIKMQTRVSLKQIRMNASSSAKVEGRKGRRR